MNNQQVYIFISIKFHQINIIYIEIYIHITIVISRDFSMFSTKKITSKPSTSTSCWTRSVGSTSGSAQSDSWAKPLGKPMGVLTIKLIKRPRWPGTYGYKGCGHPWSGFPVSIFPSSNSMISRWADYPIVIPWYIYSVSDIAKQKELPIIFSAGFKKKKHPQYHGKIHLIQKLDT